MPLPQQPCDVLLFKNFWSQACVCHVSSTVFTVPVRVSGDAIRVTLLEQTMGRRLYGAVHDGGVTVGRTDAWTAGGG